MLWIPDLLSARAMGDDTVQDEIDRIKAEIHRHEETLADAEPTDKGFKALRPPHIRAQLESRRLKEQLEKWQVEYEELKEYLATTTDEILPSRFVRLFELAAELGLESDWEHFITELQASAAPSLSGLRRLIKHKSDPDLHKAASKYETIAKHGHGGGLQ